MYFFEDNNFRSLLILATVIGNTKNNLVILNQLISYNIYRIYTLLTSPRRHF